MVFFYKLDAPCHAARPTVSKHEGNQCTKKEYIMHEQHRIIAAILYTSEYIPWHSQLGSGIQCSFHHRQQILTPETTVHTCKHQV